MKTIIAGSRSVINYRAVRAILNNYHTFANWDHAPAITEVVSGCCRGPDLFGEWWAEEYDIPIKRFPAYWNTEGRSAGYKRNERMAMYADNLIAFWDGHSKGTHHMIDLANRQGLYVHIHTMVVSS